MRTTTWQNLAASIYPAIMQRFVKEATQPELIVVQALCEQLDALDRQVRSLSSALDAMRDRLPEEPEELPETTDPEFMEDPRDALVLFVRDLGQYGLRTDLTPTKRMRSGDEGWDRNEEFWHSYLKRADDGLRAAAKQALKEAGL